MANKPGDMLIKEPIATGPPTAANGTGSAPASLSGMLTARADREYVAGSGYQLTASYLRSLPFYVDDITRDFGDDLYQRMAQDPTVSGCIEFIKMSVLRSALTLSPTNADDPAAVEMSDWARANIEQIKTPAYNVWYNLLDAVALGSRCAEVIYRPVGAEVWLSDIKVRPRRAIVYVVDAYSNVVGVLGLIPGQFNTLSVTTILDNPENTPNLLPRSKFAILTFRPNDNDPRGRSILRPAYNAWNLKQQLYGEYLKYLTQFAVPSIWGTTPEGALANNPVYDANGAPVVDPLTGNQLNINPQQSMLNTLLAFQNGTAMAFPAGTEVTPLQVSGDGSAFTTAFDRFDREITQAILCQTRATMEAEHGSKADSGTAQDVVGMVVAHCKTQLEECIRRDILYPLVALNFGADAARDLTPLVSFSDVEHFDFAAHATAVSHLQQSGYLDPSQYAGIDDQMGLPPRDPASVDRAIAMQEKALTDPAPDPNAMLNPGSGDAIPDVAPKPKPDNLK